MVRTKQTLIASLVATVVCFAIAGYLVQRYRNPVPPGRQFVRLAGIADPVEVVEDMSPEEAGALSGPRYLTSRQQHIHNRRFYQALVTSAAAQDLETAKAIIRTHLRRELSDTASDQEAIEGLSKTTFDDLVERLAIAYMVASGWPRAQYVATLPSGNQVTAGPYAESLSRVSAHWISAGSGDLPGTFNELYDVSRSYREGRDLATHWAVDEEGFVASARLVGKGESQELLYLDFQSLSSSEQELMAGRWYTTLGQGGFVVHHPSKTLQTTLEEGTKVLMVQVGMVLHSYDDAYPITVLVWLDPETKRWWLGSVTRRSSVRASNAPPLIF